LYKYGVIPGQLVQLDADPEQFAQELEQAKILRNYETKILLRKQVPKAD